MPNDSPPVPKTVAGLIALWPSTSEFARDLGLKRESHGTLMKMRGVIHVRHWPRMIMKARERGIDGVTADALLEAHSGAVASGDPDDEDLAA